MNEPKPYTSSEVYALASNDPVVFARVLRLPYLVASLLNWRSTSRTLLTYLIGTLENGLDWVEMSHSELSAGLWPSLGDESGKNKLSRWLASFDEDQELSGFCAVKRKPGRMMKALKIGDDAEFIPSKYRVERFWDFVEVVGCRIVEAKALELPTVRERSAQQRWIAAAVLAEFGAGSILPAMREESENRKKLNKERKAEHKKIRDAKEGRVALTVAELDALNSSLSDLERFDILLGQCLLFADRYFDMAESIESFGQAYSAIESAGKLFDERRERSLARLRGWEKMKQDARRRQLKVA